MLREIDSTDGGARGDQGPPGEAGSPGEAGPQGTQGLAGAAGQAGGTGPRGAPGSEGSQGPQGPRGVPGIQGEAGPLGEKGDTGYAGYPGQSFTIDFVVDDVALLDNYPDGWAEKPFDTPTTGQFALFERTLYRFSNNKWDDPPVELGGAQGAPGVRGTDGTPGDDGAPGEVGIRGNAGPDANTAAVLVVKGEAQQGLDAMDDMALKDTMDSEMARLEGLVTELQARVDRRA